MASVARTQNSVDTTEQRTIEIRRIRIRTSDHEQLVGRTFVPADRQDDPVAAILLAGGTGIPRYFYDAFATYLAQNGYAVLSFDYRGIGESAPDRLRGYQASKLDWGRLDLSAAFDRLQLEWPNVPYLFFGHSVGGQLVALMRGAEKLSAVATYGSAFGYWGGMDGSYKYFVASLWYVGIPVLTSVFGYAPAQRLGLGVDLPRDVARDWARWGKRSDYFADEIGGEPGFAEIRAPWKAFVACDDEIATPSNAHGLYDMYATDIVVDRLLPARFGYDDIGHLKFFSRARQEAWPVVVEWFDRFTLGE